MENLFKNKYRIDSTRLKEWDYSSEGHYFVTACVKNRDYVFGYVDDGKMILSGLGVIAEKCWNEIPCHFPFVILDEHVIMPDHVHGIIIIKHDGNVETQDVETQNVVETQNLASLLRNGNRFGPQSKNLGSIIRGFKIGVTKWANKNNISFQWQPRFYDRIIRNEKELFNVRNYILNNPLKWEEDKDYIKTQNVVIRNGETDVHS